MDMLLNRERATDIMARESIDGLIARLPVNRYYLSNYLGFYSLSAGYDSCYFAVLPRDADAPEALIVPVAEQNCSSWMNSVCCYGDGATFGGAFAALAAAVKAAGLDTARIAVDDVRTADWLRAAGSDRVNSVYAPHLFNEIRLVKSAAEIELLKQAAHCNEMALLLAADSMEEGATPGELENMYRMVMAQQGGRGDYFAVDAVQTNAPLALEAAGHFQHYYATFGRCGVLGEAGREQRRRHAHLLAGWEKAQEILQPGLSYRQLSETIGDTVRKAGLRQFSDPLIRSIGLEHTDDPRAPGSAPLSAGSSAVDTLLQPDMVISIRMPYREPGWGALHIEDTVRITTYGHERLTRTDRSIRVSGNTD